MKRFVAAAKSGGEMPIPFEQLSGFHARHDRGASSRCAAGVPSSVSAPVRGLDILVVSQFFAPEMGAPAARFHDFGKLLIERGHRVTILTGFPNSPSGLIPDAYRGKLAMSETIDGITVLRGWLFASPKLSKFTKAAGFASFAASASLQALLRRVRAGRRRLDLAAADRRRARHAARAPPRRAAALRRARHLARGDRRVGPLAERHADPRARAAREARSTRRRAP